MGIRDVSGNYAVGWGTLALINAGLAQSKGRSRLAWFLASLLLGPIATLLVVVTEKERPKEPAPPATVDSAR